MTTTTRQPVRIATVEINELNNFYLEFDVVDQDGVAVPLLQVVTFTLDLYNDGDGSHINNREELDILNVNDGTYHATSGRATFAFESADNPIVGTIPRGRRQPHTGRFTLTWGAGSPPSNRWDGEVKIMVANLGHVGAA